MIGNEYFDDINEYEDDEKGLIRFSTKVVEYSREETCLADFKKDLFKATRVFRQDKLDTMDNRFFDEVFWLSEINILKEYFNGNIAITKDGHILEDYILNCLIDYKKIGLRIDLTPAYLIYISMKDYGYKFNEEKENKIGEVL